MHWFNLIIDELVLYGIKLCSVSQLSIRSERKTAIKKVNNSHYVTCKTFFFVIELKFIYLNFN